MNEIEKKNIFDVTEENFNDKVLETSSSKLILVDFWAPWCGPCKQLTPILEKIINKTKGEVHLAKINIDENKQIASQLNIQSIPAVFAFKDKKIVDAFQGVLPENKIIEFIEKILKKKIEKNYTEVHEIINQLLLEGKYQEVKDFLENHFAENSDDIKSISLYIDCLIEMNLFDEVDNFIKSLSDEIINKSFIKASLKKLYIKKKNSKGPSLEILKRKYDEKPNNISNIISLADKLFSENLRKESFDLLLKHYVTDKKAIKNKLLEFFEALGNDDENTILYRKKLSSLIFS